MNQPTHNSHASQNPYGVYTQQNQNWETQRQEAVCREQHNQWMQDLQRQQEEQQREQRQRREQEHRDAERRQQRQEKQARQTTQTRSSHTKTKTQSDSNVFKFSFVVAFLTFMVVAGVVHSMEGTSTEQTLIAAGVAAVFIGFLWRVIFSLAAISGVLYVVYLVMQSQ